MEEKYYLVYTVKDGEMLKYRISDNCGDAWRDFNLQVWDVKGDYTYEEVQTSEIATYIASSTDEQRRKAFKRENIDELNKEELAKHLLSEFTTIEAKLVYSTMKEWEYHYLTNLVSAYRGYATSDKKFLDEFSYPAIVWQLAKEINPDKCYEYLPIKNEITNELNAKLEKITKNSIQEINNFTKFVNEDFRKKITELIKK